MKVALVMTFLALAVCPSEAHAAKSHLLKKVIGTWCGLPPNGHPTKLAITPVSLTITAGPDATPNTVKVHPVSLGRSIAMTYFIFHDTFNSPPPPPYITYIFSDFSRDGKTTTQTRYDGRTTSVRLRRCA